MGLTALEIYKQLPKTNCRKCGTNTCLAFAMQLAAGKMELTKCPDISDEAKVLLESSTKPPIKEYQIGKHKVGGETVVFRHEKKFHNPCLFFVSIDVDNENALRAADDVINFSFERVGQEMRFEGLHLHGNDIQKANEIIAKIKKRDGMVVLSEMNINDQDVPIVNFEKNGGEATVSFVNDFEDMKNSKQEYGKKMFGIKQQEPKKLLEILTKARWAPIKENKKEIGIPIVTFPHDLSTTVTSILKYASIVVIPYDLFSHAKTFFALRQAIYSNPQKPLQMEPGVYEINNPNPDSPVLVTTNFSLTYYTVSGDIETSKVPVTLVVVDTDGQSVLTSLASEKLTAEKIVKTLKEKGIMERKNHNKIVIPGLTSVMKGEIEDISDLDVIVGPRSSSKIKDFLVNMTKEA